MTNVTLYGPAWSAYTRTARLVLEEKGVNYNLKEVDFSTGNMPAEHFNLHPFGKVPVFSHGNYVIYETTAICRYVDEAFNGPALQPTNVQALGRMAQIIAIFDSYLSENIRMGYVSELLINPMTGLTPDENIVKNSRIEIVKGFSELAKLLADHEFFTGHKITLADLHAAPLFDYLAITPGGDDLIGAQPTLLSWWTSVKTRSSIVVTEPDLTVFGIS